MDRPVTRRRLLHSTALAGLGTTAGCLSTGSPTGDGGETTAESTATGRTSESTASETPQTTPLDSLDEWLADANGYDGETTRYGPRAQPRIDVGKPTDDGLAFDPPVVEVAPMTPVTWDWTHHGGQRNVVALDGTFDSGRTNAQFGTSYRYVFDEKGEYAFVSEPHRDEGMKGAVVVKDPPATGYAAVDRWAVESSNFDGTVADETDADTATVTVGAEGNGGRFAFDPPVVKVSPGTTVEWEWTGEGGSHSVVFQDVDIDSGSPEPSSGVNFEHTFEESGSYLYACAPHEALDMRGAVVVE